VGNTSMEHPGVLEQKDGTVFVFGTRAFMDALGIESQAVNRIIIDVQHDRFADVWIKRAEVAPDGMTKLIDLLDRLNAVQVHDVEGADHE
jgi:hypothetical protein